MKIRFLSRIFEKMVRPLTWDGKERAAFLLCNRSSNEISTTLLPHEVLVPHDSDYISRSAGYCEVSKPYINTVFNTAIEMQRCVIKVHTHPPGYPAIYSPVDERSEPEFLAHIASKIEGMQLASLVFNDTLDSCDGWYFDRETSSLQPIEKVVIVGPESLEVMIPHRSPLMGKALPPELTKTALAFGEGRARKIGCMDIAVIGASGLGAPMIELVSRDRPNSLLICDPDEIEASNLNRLIGATEKDIGKNKALHYAKLVSSISPDTKVTAYPTSFYETAVQKGITQADIAIGCVDSGARHAINQLALAHIIPYFDLGASIQSEAGTPGFIGGQVYSVIPGRKVCLSCSGVFDGLLPEYLSPKTRQADARQGYIKGDDGIESPLVAHLDFIIASLGYYEALSYVMGLPGKSSFKIFFDQLNDKISRSNCKTEGCVVCRPGGYLGRGDKVPFLRPQHDGDESAILSLLKENVPSDNEVVPGTRTLATDETQNA